MKKSVLFILLLCFALTISAYAKPMRVTGMIGIKLGDTVDKLKEVLGEPFDENERTITYKTKDYPVAIFIYIDEAQKVGGIAVYDPSYSANVQGVGIGTSAKRVKKIFGKPDITKVDKIQKQYSSWNYYKAYNVEFLFDNGLVNGIVVSTP